MIYRFIYFPLLHRALYCFPQNTPRRSTVTLTSLHECAFTIELVDIECALGHVTGDHFYKTFALINPPYWIYLYSRRIIQKFLHKLSSNKKLSSKFLCEEYNFKTKNDFAFPTKRLRASSVALINPPFCGDTSGFDWHEIGTRILYLLILWHLLTQGKYICCVTISL